MLPVGLLIGRYAYKTVDTLPKALLVPSVALMTITGPYSCLLYTSDAADDLLCLNLGGRRTIKKKKTKQDTQHVESNSKIHL